MQWREENMTRSRRLETLVWRVAVDICVLLLILNSWNMQVWHKHSVQIFHPVWWRRDSAIRTVREEIVLKKIVPQDAIQQQTEEQAEGS